MKKMELSIRMKAVADMVLPGRVVADIGCDHAFVSIYLIKNNIAKYVMASDVRKGPLEIAKANISKYGYTEQIHIEMADGLATLKIGSVGTAIIAGMGGTLITDILEASQMVAESIEQFVLQPQSDIEKVRRYVENKGFVIARECFVKDAEKFYTILDVRNARLTGMELQKYEKTVYYKYGKNLLLEKNSQLYEYLTREFNINDRVLKNLKKNVTENSLKRAEEIEEELHYINCAMEFFKEAL